MRVKFFYDTQREGGLSILYTDIFEHFLCNFKVGNGAPQAIFLEDEEG